MWHNYVTAIIFGIPLLLGSTALCVAFSHCFLIGEEHKRTKIVEDPLHSIFAGSLALYVFLPLWFATAFVTVKLARIAAPLAGAAVTEQNIAFTAYLSGLVLGFIPARWAARMLIWYAYMRFLSRMSDFLRNRIELFGTVVMFIGLCIGFLLGGAYT